MSEGSGLRFLSRLHSRVQHVPQAVPGEVQSEHGKRDGHAREDRDPGRVLHVVERSQVSPGPE